LEPAHITKLEVKALLAIAQRLGGKAQRELLLEGNKMVVEAIRSGWNPLKIVLGPLWIKDTEGILMNLDRGITVRRASGQEMERISRLKTAPSIIGCFEIPDFNQRFQEARKSSLPSAKVLAPWWLVADRIQDPGNLGTMIRIADWFGFEGLICSPDTVDCYNPKVVQASMGSLFRLPVHYAELNPAELSRLTGMHFFDLMDSDQTFTEQSKPQEMPWIVASMPGGMDLNRIQFPKQGGVLLVGNESQGLSQNVLDLATHRVGIPSFGSAESLNAAVATGIFANSIRQAEAIESEGS
jgi:TrmH family RNA methyltransferase